MKLSLKYGLIIALIIFSVVGTFLLILNPMISNTLKEIVLSSFLNEVKVISKIGSLEVYESLFQTEPSFGYYYVLDSEGTAIFHNKQDLIGKNARTLVPGLFEFMESKKEGIYSYMFEGTMRYIAFSFDGKNYLAHAASETELFYPVKKLNKIILKYFLPMIILASLIIGYVLGELLVRPTRKQYAATTSLLRNISDNVVTTASSAAEIQAMAQNTESAYSELDKAVTDIATYFEESRAETETTIERIREFTDTIEEITNSVSALINSIKSISDFVERITEISDNITVLAINASIETSKETIDRDGISRISEMIMELSNSTRSLAKESKNSIKELEKVATSTVLITEKISKDLNSVRESLNVINQVITSSSENTEKLSNISNTVHSAVEQLYGGIKMLEESINNIRTEIQKFSEIFSKIKL